VLVAWKMVPSEGPSIALVDRLMGTGTETVGAQTEATDVALISLILVVSSETSNVVDTGVLITTGVVAPGDRSADMLVETVVASEGTNPIGVGTDDGGCRPRAMEEATVLSPVIVDATIVGSIVNVPVATVWVVEVGTVESSSGEAMSTMVEATEP
jgi:hypothetical protein